MTRRTFSTAVHGLRPRSLAAAPLPASHTQRQARRSLQVRAASSDEQPEPKVTPGKKGKRKGKETPEVVKLDDFNPYSIGRKSRAIFDDVWQQFTKLSSPTRSFNMEQLGSAGDRSEFETPQAAFTTVLVAGATGRVGRVLVRKLLLRGYTVKALVRKREGMEAATGFPSTVTVVNGDVGDYEACKAACEGVDKIVYCASARTTMTGDLKRVNEDGPEMLAVAYHDTLNAKARRRKQISSRAKKEVVKFTREDRLDEWQVQEVKKGEDNMSKVRSKYRAKQSRRDEATVTINKQQNLVFEGTLYSMRGSAEAGSPLRMRFDESLKGCEGLLVRAKTDGQPYILTLTTSENKTYTARISAPADRFANNRVPFNAFRPAEAGDPPLEPVLVDRIGVRFEARNRTLQPVLTNLGSSSVLGDLDSNKLDFRFEMEYIKALPGGEETDFVMVSCAGAPLWDRDSEAAAVRDKRVGPLRRGEAALRKTGLGYTIIRPGPLLEEPGGYKALVFDQGERITQGISCADVADVCLKALHDPLARNKTFEVCYEYTPEAGLAMYELVAHLPDKANNYLGPALATLEKNT
ncbi:hypothetical protein WJX72_006181 [[Myrmecia] bisecta]|uniref:Uncharacterized protein n=1 Tax=[Myrmecia] bisecta TaxID=41462 RepID=A0AAW1PJ76_9CHLO